jgi:tellurite resistance protein TerC
VSRRESSRHSPASNKNEASLGVIVAAMAVATIASLVKARIDSKRRGAKLMDEVPHFTEDAPRREH